MPTNETARTGSGSHFIVTFADHDRRGAIDPVAVDDCFDWTRGIDAGQIVAALPQIVSEARKSAAARLIDFDSYDNDSAYLDALDRLSETLVPDTVIMAGPRERYGFLGHYSDGEGVCEDSVDATCQAEAEFQAKWMMATNEGALTDDIENFACTMEGVEIEDCYPDPVTKDELIELLARVVVEAQSAGVSSPSIDEAVSALSNFGRTLEPVSAPRM